MQKGRSGGIKMFSYVLTILLVLEIVLIMTLAIKVFFMINKPGGDILEEIYELICTVDEALTTLLRKSIKRKIKISAKEFLILVYLKIRNSRYKRDFSKVLKKNKNLKNQEHYQEALEAMAQTLYKEYGTLEELAEKLKQMSEEF